MRKYMLLLALTALAFTARAQVSNPSIVLVASAPTGACSAGLPNQQVASTGAQYSCQDATGGHVLAQSSQIRKWVAISATASACTIESGIWDGSFVYITSSVVYP